MKAAASFECNAAGPMRSLCTITADSVLGWRYWRAAEKDEKNGFPFTAAVEWQWAAECFGWLSLISDRCWREWERITHLPRRLASPIGEPEQVMLQYAPAVPDSGAQEAEGLVHAASAA
jgi:hypothetical protein